jgi:hypothetical protein
MAGPFSSSPFIPSAVSFFRRDIYRSPSNEKHKEQNFMASLAKKVYSTPELTIHGSVEEITQVCMNKEPGASDGMTVAQQPVHTQCS